MRVGTRSNGHHGVYGRGAEAQSEWGAVRVRARPLHVSVEWQWQAPCAATTAARGRPEAVRIARARGRVRCLGTSPAPERVRWAHSGVGLLLYT